MASFGSFETEREVYSDLIYTVFSAKRTGDPKAETYAIKLFSLQLVELGAEVTAELGASAGELERPLVDRIAIQAQAAAGSEHVAPIFETGTDERGVWYATKFYPRSVNKIISGRVALNQESLHHILQGTAQGALDFKRICGRSHGGIRPTNIQISRSEKISEAKVVLSDPLPGGDAEATAHELADLKAIGEILVQLVLQRDLSEGAEWLILPLLSSPEWTRLFPKDGDRWLALCNRLLDPNLSLDQITLEQVVAELEQLKPKPPVSRNLVVATTAVLVLLGVVAFLVLRPSTQGRLEITSDPPGAEIKLEAGGQFQSRGKTPDDQKSLVLTLPKGTHKLRADYPGLLEQSAEITVEGGKTHPHQFLFPYGRVQITSTPANASVELDDKAIGVTPYSSPALAPAPLVYTLRLTNHQPERVSILVSSNRQVVAVEKKLSRVKIGDGTVEFKSVPDQARIMEGAVSLNEEPTPFYKSLAAGPHKVTAQIPDWPPVTKDIVVMAGDNNPPVEFYFPHGVALFTLKPEEAEIFVNDKRIGRVRRKLLPPGDYTVRAEHPGYKPAEAKITIAEGKTIPLSFTLTPTLGVVEFTSVPPGAAIFEAKAPDQELGRTLEGEPRKLTFQPGTYAFIARFKDLDEVRSEPLNVAMGANIPLELRFKFGTVQFDTEPHGAKVLIGGKLMESTPYTHRQKPGPVAYTLELPDYDPVAAKEELAAGATIAVSRKLRPKEVGLVLRSVPTGAQYYMAETQLQGTNDSFRLPWGTHAITARYPGLPGLPGLDPLTNSVEVDKSGTTAVKFELNFASLEITNVEPDAKVLYQNQPIAVPPAIIFLNPNVQYGDFVLAYDPEFRTNLFSGQLAAGKSFTPAITLPELRRAYTNSLNMVLIQVSKDLYVCKFEVSEQEYQNVVGRAVESKPNAPIVNVTWADALAFCEKLTPKDAATLEQNRLPGWSYALPTETEWARFAETDPGQLAGAVFGRLAGPLEIDPLRKSFNPRKLFDLFGNVAEWCYGANKQPMTIGGAHNQPRPRQFPDDLMRISDAARLGRTITEGSPNTGFRCVLRRSAP